MAGYSSFPESSRVASVTRVPFTAISTYVDEGFRGIFCYIVLMGQFVASNIAWVYQYFDKNKGLLEMFSFLMVAQSFIYGSNLQDITVQSVAAFKIVLWVMIFLVILLLQISTAVEVEHEDGEARGRILAGANFMKMVMRLLTLVLLLATVPIFIKQIEVSLHNSLFSVLYISLGLTVLLEVIAFIIAKVLPGSLKPASGSHRSLKG